MAFNSYQFLFLLLPPLLAGFLLLSRFHSHRAALGWLLVGSIAFYAWSNLLSLAILLPSIALDYVVAQAMLRADPAKTRWRGALLAFGVLTNVAFLGYFKYKNFFLETSNQIFSTGFDLAPVILPLGISFLTFQKIAFLADVHSGEVKKVGPFDFLLFTLFFPRTVAGPIVHYQEVMPRLLEPGSRLAGSNFAAAVCLFSIGLFKKVVIADTVAQYVPAAFEPEGPLTLFVAWSGVLAYTFQLYFDFSGYSDMAMALAMMFGVRLPANFNSPFKASSIIDFWGRWHISLTRFLTAYIYTPMVMSLTRARMARGRPVLRGKKTVLSAILVLVAFPTLVTMAISGLWHGAGYQFIVWGLFHGMLLSVNQGWRMLRPRFWADNVSHERVMKPVGFVLTFGCVVIGLVFFRAHSIGEAMATLQAMAGLNGVSIPHVIGDRLGVLGQMLLSMGITFDFSSGSQLVMGSLWVIVLFAVVQLAPNSLELLAKYQPSIDGPQAPVRGMLTLNRAVAAAAALLMVAGVMGLSRGTTFLYWQF